MCGQAPIRVPSRGHGVEVSVGRSLTGLRVDCQLLGRQYTERGLVCVVGCWRRIQPSKEGAEGEAGAPAGGRQVAAQVDRQVRRPWPGLTDHRYGRRYGLYAERKLDYDISWPDPWSGTYTVDGSGQTTRTRCLSTSKAHLSGKRHLRSGRTKPAGARGTPTIVLLGHRSHRDRESIPAASKNSFRHV